MILPSFWGYFVQKFYFSEQSKIFYLVSYILARLRCKKTVRNFRRLKLLNFIEEWKRVIKGKFLLFD